MDVFRIRVENKATGNVFECEEYGHSKQEIIDFWVKSEKDGTIGSYHLISCEDQAKPT